MGISSEQAQRGIAQAEQAQGEQDAQQAVGGELADRRPGEQRQGKRHPDQKREDGPRLHRALERRGQAVQDQEKLEENEQRTRQAALDQRACRFRFALDEHGAAAGLDELRQVRADADASAQPVDLLQQVGFAEERGDHA